MLHDRNGLEILDEDECHVLVNTTRLGRIALSHQALPVILPVTFATVGRDVVFGVSPGVLADAAIAGNVVCFQTDWTDENMLAAWSVSMIGRLTALTTPVEICGAQHVAIAPWSSDELRYVRLRPAVVSGRRRNAMPPGAASPT